MFVINEQSEEQALRPVRRDNMHGCCFRLSNVWACVIAEMKKDGANQ